MVCYTCNNRKLMVEMMNIIPINIQNKNSRNLTTHIKDYEKQEFLERDDANFFCKKCQDFTPVHKSQEIYSPAPIIALSLQRVKNNRKITDHVDFPLEGLEMSQYVSGVSPQK